MRCILLATAKEEVRELLRPELEKAGYSVVEATSGLEALARAGQGNPDAILLDIDLNVEGEELVGAIHELEHLANMPVLFLSDPLSYRQEETRTSLLENLATATYIKALQDQVRKQKLYLEKLASTDGLTGCYNRRFIESELKKQISRAKRHGSALSIGIMDIDFFKQINDQYGHRLGDEVLKCLVKRTWTRLREEDSLGRYGGEEFLVILPETTPLGAKQLFEELIGLMAKTPVQYKQMEVKLTISLGWTAFREEDDIDSLIQRADKYLYQAKRRGRNQARGGI